METTERRRQGLCYYCDDRYSPGHKCVEQKFFQIDTIENSLVDEALPTIVLEEEEVEPKDTTIDITTTLVITCPHTSSLSGINAVSAYSIYEL